MKKNVKNIELGIKCCILACFILSLFFVILYKYVPVYYAPQMLKPNIQHQWIALKKISPHLVQAVLASEDYWFLIHNGFNYNNENLSMNRGAQTLCRENRTISQQTARAVFLFAGDSYCNKLLESYFTVLIELVWGKERIMEVYLNSIEMGNQLFGAEATSQAYYAVSAEDLSTFEAAGIAACLIHPKKLNPCVPDTYILRRQNKIKSVMEDMIEIEWK